MLFRVMDGEPLGGNEAMAFPRNRSYSDRCISLSEAVIGNVPVEVFNDAEFVEVVDFVD